MNGRYVCDRRCDTVSTLLMTALQNTIDPELRLHSTLLALDSTPSGAPAAPCCGM